MKHRLQLRGIADHRYRKGNIVEHNKLGWSLVVVGAVVAAVSLAADPLGIGAQPGIIGWKQWLGAGAGAVVLVLGTWLAVRRTPPQ